MIFDCHTHHFRYPDHFPDDKYVTDAIIPLRGEEAAEETRQHLDRPASVILDLMDEAGVDKSLVLGFKAPETMYIDVANNDLAEEVKPHRERLSWACCVVMTEPDAAKEVERCVKELGAAAIEEIGPGYALHRMDDPRCFPVYEVAQSLDVPILIHAGQNQPSNTLFDHGDLAALDAVCVKFPNVTIVLCHFGDPFYQEGAFLLSKHENLYADVSQMPGHAGLSPRKPARVSAPSLHIDLPLLYYFSMPLGDTDKLLWGSDMDTPKESLDGFRGVNGRLEKMGMPKIPEDALHRMFHENWQRVFTKIS